MERMRRDEGAMTAEYVAVLLLVAMLAAVLAVGGLAPRVAEGARHALCQLFTGGPCPGGPVTGPEPLNRMGLPCLTRRDATDIGFSLVVRSIQMDRGAGYMIEQLGTGTYRVTMYGTDALGVGTLFGDGPGSLGKRTSGAFGWITGKYGAASLSAGGRVSVSYDFRTREAAEAFAKGQRGGFKQWLHTAGGAQGHVVTQGWEWLKRRITRQKEPEPTFTSVQVNVRGQGRLGYNGGCAGGRGAATAMGSGVLTRIHGNRWTVFTGSLDGSAGGGASALFASGDVGGGGALRYRVVFDEDRQPLRLVTIGEYGYTGTLGADIAGVRQKQSPAGRGAGAGVGEAYSDSRVRITERNLDLRDPANRAAFDRAFDYVPGVAAWPRIRFAGPGTVGTKPLADDMRALAELRERVRADGVKVELEYAEGAPSAGAGAVVVGRGLYGFNGAKEDIHRDLLSATIHDSRWADPAPRRFTDCWTDARGAGVPSGTGAPGEGPGP